MTRPCRDLSHAVGMTHPSRIRARFRLGVTSLTALVSAVSLTAVGWFAGAAARDEKVKQARDDAAGAAAAAKAARAQARYEAAVARAKSASYPHQVVLRARPTRTVVHTRYVHSASAPVTVGGGMFVPAPSSAAAPPPAVHHAAPVVHAPPPPPPPPPAPSSGSHHG
jgi:hypothetical protein